MKKDEINNLKNQLQLTTKKLMELDEDRTKIMLEYEKLKAQINLNNLDNLAEVAQAPLFDFDINNQFLQNGNYEVNENIMVKQSMLNQIPNMNGDYDGNVNFFLYQLILERAQYFKKRIDFITENKDLKILLPYILYYGSLNGIVALTKNYEIMTINNIENNIIKGKEINIFNIKHKDSKELNYSIKDVAIYKFNENNFSLWVICWHYLNKLNNYFKILDSQTKYLNKQLAVKIPTEKLAANNNKLKQDLFNLGNPCLFLDKETELAPLQTPDNILQAIFTFIENFKNWMDFNLLNMITKDITTDKERDVASQQSNFGQLTIIKEKYLNSFVDEFLTQLENNFNIKVSYIDEIIDNAKAQAEQSLTLNKLNDRSEKEQEKW